jgi:hypothetical protein
MNRINPSEIPELYRKLGMTPITCGFYVDGHENCGCLLTALTVDKIGPEQAANFLNTIGVYGIFVMKQYDFSLDYTYGLMNGFDGNILIHRNEEHILGIQDGMAARHHLIQSGFTVLSREQYEMRQKP